jgi:PiT family inorganic phosphate transporter
VKAAPSEAPADSRKTLMDYVRTSNMNANVVPALAAVTGTISDEINRLQKSGDVNFDTDTTANVKEFKKQIDDGTKFIPLWVKVAVILSASLYWIFRHIF